MVVAAARNSLPYSRLGISVGRKFGNAVRRNRAKRRVREFFRRNKHKIPRGYDFIFLPQKNMLEIPWEDLCEKLVNVLRYVDKR